MSATSHFSWRINNIQAYKTLTHQHLAEINETLSAFEGGENCNIHFVPWRGDFARGIFVSSQFKSAMPLEELEELYAAFYENHPFTVFSRRPIHLKQVINTNKCMVQLEKKGKDLVVHTCLDNLLKGAVGQAVQNMNLVFGFDEAAGLKLKSIGY